MKGPWRPQAYISCGSLVLLQLVCNDAAHVTLMRGSINKLTRSAYLHQPIIGHGLQQVGQTLHAQHRMALAGCTDGWLGPFESGSISA